MHPDFRLFDYIKRLIMHPKVTVIIPVYNCLPYIHECLDSVVNQTLQDIEVILIDDGCSDGTEKVINAYAKKDKRIKLLRQSNQGAAIARNNGLAVAKGEYLSFLDSDDIFDLNMLEEMYIQAKKFEVDLVICPFRYLGDDLSIRRGLTLPTVISDYNLFSNNDVASQLFQISIPTPWNKLIKRSLVLSHNLSFQSLTSNNDVSFCYLVVALSDKISILNNVYVSYRNRAEGAISRKRGEDMTNIINAFKCLKQSLIDRGIYSKFELSFAKRGISQIAYESLYIETKDDLVEFVENTISYLGKLLDV